MAKISDETLDIVFDLQRQLHTAIDRSSHIALLLFEQFGENHETEGELSELDSMKEKAIGAFSRLNNSVLLISQYQPVANIDQLNLLEVTIDSTISLLAATKANISEIKRNWNIDYE